MKNFIAMLAVLLMAGVAMGAKEAPRNSTKRGLTYEMCVAATNTGPCENADTVDVYALIHEDVEYTVYFEASDPASDATCDVYVSHQDRFNHMPVALLTTHGWKISSTAMSLTAGMQSFKGPFFFMWIDCTADTVGGHSHDVWIQTAK